MIDDYFENLEKTILEVPLKNLYKGECKKWSESAVNKMY
ncbi:MAG: hypothetical protein QG657_3002 [Acidobacteriota bacterium]|nr:hypothetical protein [Acidobacteriota bacterium]